VPLLAKHSILPGFVSLFYKGKVGISYVFISNLISSTITIILLLPDILKIKYRFDLYYGKNDAIFMPLLIVGFAGIINETMDRVFLKYLLPENIALSQVVFMAPVIKFQLS